MTSITPLCKKLMAMVFGASIAALNAFGIERISVDEVVNHYPWDGKIDCVCTVSGFEYGYAYKGAFTLSVKKAGEAVRRTITNAFTSADGTYTNTFDCTALFGAGLYPNGGITVDLVKKLAKPADATGDPIGIVGDVLVIDVSAGSTASSYPTAEFSEVDIGTFNCDVYKTDKIVIKKIPAGTYYCQPGADDSTTVSQQLTTAGFYIGVFPVTQRQYARVMGANPSYCSTDADGNVAAQRPVEQVSWDTIRGSVAAGETITASSANSFLQRLVAKTGLSGFDLPTEAQWEMACRAGATAAYGVYWNGTAAVELTLSTNGKAAWYCDNSSSTTHATGGKRPNLWGLYDMQGNVWEWCRDIYISTYSTSYVDMPCMDTSFYSGGRRVRRGGSWFSGVRDCRPSSRGLMDAGSDNYNGFRLSRTLP